MRIPRVVRIEPSAKCNLSCRHCPTGTIEMSRGVMSNEVFERCLDFIRYDEVKVIVLYHGGEPLLNKDFYLMVNRIKKSRKDILIKTVSNGVALTKANANKLIFSGIDEVEFSLDGLSFVENDYIRVRGGGGSGFKYKLSA